LTPLNVVINIMSWIPSTSFTPIPSGPVNKAAEGIIKLSDLITMAEHKISGITIHLETVLSHMKRVLDLLAMLDFLIQGCAEDLANAEDLVECTLPDGSIQMMTKEDCMAAGGSCCGDLIRGDLIKCTLPNGEVKLMTKEDCLAAGGICCGLILCTLPDGSVKPMLPEACLSAGGSFNNLIDCTLPDGTIQQMTKEDCLAAGGSCCGIGWKLTRGLGRLGPPKKPPPTPVSPYTDPKGSVWVYNDGELDLSNLGDGDGIGGQSDNQLLVQSQISQQILDSTKKQSNQLSPLVTNVNGFDMGIESEQHTKSLKRRRAIAKNKNEVVMLKGEWSFSADDQILIDELVFFIQQNDLKA